MAGLLSVKNLSLNFQTRNYSVDAVRGISFDLARGETLGIVGESGSGKSVTALSIMQLLKNPGRITGGEIWFQSQKQNQLVNLLSLADKEMNAFRGNEIGMIFQEPMSSLNPVMSCGKQVTEALTLHRKVSITEARKETIALFEKVKLPNPDKIFDSYPHQLSGGQIQRVMTAMAISCKPSLLIADEPTTALDVTTQRSILSLLKELQQEYGMSMIFISHDLGVVSHIADHISVMRSGEIMEFSSKEKIFRSPEHHYTQGLLACKPPMDVKLKRLPVVEDFVMRDTAEANHLNNIVSGDELKQHLQKLMHENVLVEVQNVSVEFSNTKGFFSSSKTKVKAVDQVSLKIRKGEVLGIAGESGSGKTTLGKAILKLVRTSSGRVIFNGADVTEMPERDFRPLRKKMQIIFQDPYSSLNPKIKVGSAIEEVLSFHKIALGKESLRGETIKLLKQVGLDESYRDRYPHELSGGQRQRVCIARALALKPEFLVCDECVSALDVSVQATILNLLKQLREEYNLTILFISHDLSVLKFMCDRIMVMRSGKIEEENSTEQIFENPQADYTKELLEAVRAVNV